VVNLEAHGCCVDVVCSGALTRYTIAKPPVCFGQFVGSAAAAHTLKAHPIDAQTFCHKLMVEVQPHVTLHSLKARPLQVGAPNVLWWLNFSLSSPAGEKGQQTTHKHRSNNTQAQIKQHTSTDQTTQHPAVKMPY
jgi:hypothetical protein